MDTQLDPSCYIAVGAAMETVLLFVKKKATFKELKDAISNNWREIICFVQWAKHL